MLVARVVLEHRLDFLSDRGFLLTVTEEVADHADAGRVGELHEHGDVGKTSPP